MVAPVSAPSDALGVSSSAALKASGQSTLNYESFLMLLVTQMQNQDPTSPMDAGEQMAQLASFSTVEQQIKTNAHLEDLLSLNLLSQATAMVGKELTTANGDKTGIVASVEVTSQGLTATLEDGTPVLIQQGVTISVPGDSGSADAGGGSGDASDSGNSEGGSGDATDETSGSESDDAQAA